MASRAAALVIVLASISSSASAVADDGLPNHRVDGPVDLSVTVGALALSAGAAIIPIRDRLLDGDDGDNPLSDRAAHISDVSVGIGVAAPAFYLSGSSIDDADADRLAIYAETMAIDLALVQITKHVVQRARPDAHRRPGRDPYLSFYSSHSALSFGAATAGAYLLGTSEADPTARSLAWGAGFANAAMTATLRVRAGRHWTSDVVVGALVGTAVGYAVPALHATGDAYQPNIGEIALAGSGVLLGILAGSVLPLDRTERVQLAPMGSGMGVVGRF